MSYPQGQEGRTYTQTDVPASSARRVTHGYHQQPTSWQQFDRTPKQQRQPFAPPPGMHGFGGPSTPAARDRSQGFNAPQSPMTPKTTLDYYKQKDLERSRYDDGYKAQAGYPSAQQQQMQQYERLRQLQMQRQEDERQRGEQRLRQEEDRILREEERLKQEEYHQQDLQREKDEEEKQRHMQELQRRQDEERAQRARQEQQRKYQEQLQQQQQEQLHQQQVRQQQQQQQQQEQMRQQQMRQQQEQQRKQQQERQQQQEQLHQQQEQLQRDYVRQQEQEQRQEPQTSKGAQAIAKVLQEVDALRVKYEMAAYQTLTSLHDRNQARVTYIELLNRQIDMLDLVETEGRSEVKASRKAAVGTIQKLQGALDAFVERETSLLRLLESRHGSM